MKINAEIKQGSLLKPRDGYSFDYIVSDVAVIAKDVSVISPWYKGCINDTGYDGTKHIINIISNPKKYLKKMADLFFQLYLFQMKKKF